MNYYMLPKNKNTIIFNIQFRPFVPQLYISHSLHNYISKLIKLIKSNVSNNVCDASNNINQPSNEQFENIKNIIHQ